MQLFGRSIVFSGFALAFASVVACGGAHGEAAAPKTASAEVPDLGSTSPDPAPATAPVVNAPATQTAAASKKDDGSDIIPPFPSSNGKKSAAKASKKGAKKKATTAEQ